MVPKQLKKTAKTRKLRAAGSWLSSCALGRRIYKTLAEMEQVASKALAGDSNDDEHDALFDIHKMLAEIIGKPECPG